MRAIQIHQTGGPEQLQMVDIPLPEPAPGQVRIKVAAAGVNFIDIYHVPVSIHNRCRLLWG